MCCRVTTPSPNKTCSEDNLERVIDMQHYNPLIHQQFRESKIQVGMLPWKGHEKNPTELFQAVVQQNVRKWQAPGRGAEKLGLTTIRQAQIAMSEVLGRLRFNTKVFLGFYEARATGPHI